MMGMNKPSVLAVSTTAIGDTLLNTPAIALLAQSFTVDVLAHWSWRGLLRGNPHIRRVYPYRSNILFRLPLAMGVGRRRYHRLVVLHANPSIWPVLPWLRYERAGNILGWDNPKLRMEPVEVDRTLHVAEQRASLAAWAGARPGECGPLELYLTDQELAAGREWLDQAGMSSRHPRVGFCPGAAQPQKLWPAERFGQVARGLIQDGAQVMMVGSRQEENLRQRAQQAAGREMPAALSLDLRLSAAVLAGLDLLVTNDTGPMHMALAVGTPVVAIFGPTMAWEYGPRGESGRVFQMPWPADCETCLQRKCPRPRCLEALSADEVLQAAREILGSWQGKLLNSN
jgi:ADP-heptose:LPS heptosyltransferase